MHRPSLPGRLVPALPASAIATATALALALAAPAHAQSRHDLDSAAADPAGAIVITASRFERPADSVAQSVTIITGEAIRRRQSAAVIDLLRTVPGVTVTANGGPGTFAGVNIRGAETDQNVVLIDGIKLNDPSAPGGGFNFGELLVGNIERIEVVRGSQSVIWGSQAIGGVVNLLTAAPTEQARVNLRAEGGARDTYQAFGNISGRAGPVAASAGAGFFHSDGLSAFSAARGGQEADGYEAVSANARATIDLAPAVSLDLRGFFTDGETEIDGFPPPSYAFGDTKERSETREYVGYGGLNAAMLGGRLRNRFGFAYTRTRRTSIDPDGAVQTTFDATGENERFEYQGILTLDALDATFGAETERASFVTASYGGPQAIADARITGLYAEASVAPVAGLVLTGGARYDDHDTFGDATTLAASAVYSPNGGATRLRAAYGEGFKAPSLFQLYSDYGNLRLAPERSESWEAGVSQRLGGWLELAATWFQRDTDNQIDFVSCFGNTEPLCAGRPYGTYDNLRVTRAKGVELTASARPFEGLSVIGQYSHIDAENRVTGLELARRPQRTASLIADYTFAFGLQLGGTLAHVGDSFDDAANTRPLDSYTLVDLRAAIPLSERIELFGRVENLLDEQYETVFGYGTAGRGAFGGVRLRL